MPRRLTTVCLTLLLLGASGVVADAQATQQTTPGGPVVMARGRGEVSLEPDRATVSITVRTIAEAPGQASTRNRTAAEATAAALEALDLDSLRSTGVKIGPNREYASDGMKREGYFAERSFRVSTADLAQVGAIIEAALAAGATEVDHVTYSSSKEEQARRQALAKAVENARADADAAAAAAGGRLGDLVLLSTGGVNVPRPIVPGFSSGRVIRGGRPSEVAMPAPEALTISATVEIHWTFERAGE